MTVCLRIAAMLNVDEIDAEKLAPFLSLAHRTVEQGCDELWLERNADRPGALSFTRILTELEKCVFVPLVRYDRRKMRGDWQKLGASGGDRTAVHVSWLDHEALGPDLEMLERSIGFDRVSMVVPVERVKESNGRFRICDTESRAMPYDAEQVCLMLCKDSVSEIIFTGEADASFIDYFSSLLPIPVGVMSSGDSLEQTLECFLAGADFVVFNEKVVETAKVIALREMLRKNGFPVRNE